MKKVNVVMSTYNGEAYVREQLDSILNQTYPNIHIYVRDDGSKDQTVAILKEYEKIGKITLLQGENKGFIYSFFDTLEKSGEADYYSFADQDDIWLPEKISYAVEKLEKAKENIPVLYFSNYDFYNQDMEFKEHCETHAVGASFTNSIVDCISLGFNTVINKCTRDMIIKDMPKFCCGHDWWSYMICTGMGEVIYDTRYTVKYRRHDNNVSPGGMSFFKLQVWRFKKFFKDDYFNKVREQIREYQRIYGNQLKLEDQKMLALFGANSYHFTKAIRKVFYGKKFRQSLPDEILVRVIFLMGKL
ncbi:alpha-L-Rha alpha-1,3-L-rhamnosyltransferase [Lachnospiraceae bacterium KM106-2]|nr:alpha-L-Rha alpha-1,3-L-rhamnosyltransferase [Lachnospiraceae bacterium KM106-2]